MTLRINLFILFFSSTSFVFGQTIIDSSLSIKFPGKIETSIIEESNIVAKTYAYNTDKESYILVRVALLDNGIESNTNPPDSAKLLEIYSHEVIKQIASMKRKGFVFKDSSRINIQDYIGYKLTYVDDNSSIQNAEAILLFLNGIRYSVIYSKVNDFNQKNKDKFLSSLRVLNSESVQQIDKLPRLEDSTSNNLIFKIILYLGIIIGSLMWFKMKRKSNSKLGINLKRVKCPICNTKQPIIRLPEDKEQLLYGGTTCPNCLTKLDKYGNVIT